MCVDGRTQFDQWRSLELSLMLVTPLAMMIDIAPTRRACEPASLRAIYNDITRAEVTEIERGLQIRLLVFFPGYTGRTLSQDV